MKIKTATPLCLMRLTTGEDFWWLLISLACTGWSLFLIISMILCAAPSLPIITSKQTYQILEFSATLWDTMSDLWLGASFYSQRWFLSSFLGGWTFCWLLMSQTAAKDSLIKFCVLVVGAMRNLLTDLTKGTLPSPTWEVRTFGLPPRDCTFCWKNTPVRVRLFF